MMRKTNGISVVICCYNSVERLGPTLKHLAAQQFLQKINWEILLITNACTDNSGEFAIQKWELLGNPVPLRVFDEPTPGKTNALVLAVENMWYSYMVICDDDNWLSPHYLQTAFQIMEDHPEYGVLGGRAEAVSEVDMPGWFYEVQYAYACGSPSNVSCDFTGKYLLWGAGMVLRYEVARLALSRALPPMLSCRKGSLLTSGGDDEICVRTWLIGYKSFFDYRLGLQHYMPVSRLNDEYRKKLLKGFEEQGEIISCYRRLYYLQQKKSRKIFMAKQFFVYLYSTVVNNKQAIRIAGDFLYFQTRKNIWSTEYNKDVWRFYEFVKHKA